MKKKIVLIVALTLMVCSVAGMGTCFANTSVAQGQAMVMPWDGPLGSLLLDLQGPVAKAVSVIVIVITGLMIAFGEGGAAGRKMLQIVFGIACALGGGSWVIPLFSQSAVTGVVFHHHFLL